MVFVRWCVTWRMEVPERCLSRSQAPVLNRICRAVEVAALGHWNSGHSIGGGAPGAKNEITPAAHRITLHKRRRNGPLGGPRPHRGSHISEEIWEELLPTPPRHWPASHAPIAVPGAYSQSRRVIQRRSGTVHSSLLPSHPFSTSSSLLLLSSVLPQHTHSSQICHMHSCSSVCDRAECREIQEEPEIDGGLHAALAMHGRTPTRGPVGTPLHSVGFPV